MNPPCKQIDLERDKPSHEPMMTKFADSYLRHYALSHWKDTAPM